MLALLPITSVYPSGAARATASAPTLPFAPTRFSTTTGCPRLSVIDHVVRGAPGEEKSGAVVPGRDVGKRRSVEVDAPVVDEARAEKPLDDLVARPRDLVVAPLAREIEDRVDRHADFHRRRHAAVRVGRVAFAKQRVLSGERDEPGEGPAPGITH